jgi:hypothetical protein
MPRRAGLEHGSQRLRTVVESLAGASNPDGRDDNRRINWSYSHLTHNLPSQHRNRVPM